MEKVAPFALRILITTNLVSRSVPTPMAPAGHPVILCSPAFSIYFYSYYIVIENRTDFYSSEFSPPSDSIFRVVPLAHICMPKHECWLSSLVYIRSWWVLVSPNCSKIWLSHLPHFQNGTAQSLFLVVGLTIDNNSLLNSWRESLLPLEKSSLSPFLS